jgi:hypothetical protein
MLIVNIFEPKIQTLFLINAKDGFSFQEMKKGRHVAQDTETTLARKHKRTKP